MTSQRNRAAVLVAAALIVAGCSGSGGEMRPTPVQAPPPAMQPPPTQPPPPPTETSFTSFVRGELARSDAGGAPASVNEQTFAFDDTPTSFDDLLQAAVGY